MTKVSLSDSWKMCCAWCYVLVVRLGNGDVDGGDDNHHNLLFQDTRRDDQRCLLALHCHRFATPADNICTCTSHIHTTFYLFFFRVSLKLTLKPRISDDVVENWCLGGDTWRWYDGVRGQVLDERMTELHSAWLRTPNINIYIQYLVFSQSLLINIFYLYRYLFIIYTWRLGWEAINLKR